MNPAVWVARHGRLRPEAPALADGERVHADWATFAARTAAVAAGLRDDFGVSPATAWRIVMRNRPEYLEAMFGVWRAGLVVVPINARLHRDEVAHIVEDSAAAVVIADRPSTPTVVTWRGRDRPRRAVGPDARVGARAARRPPAGRPRVAVLHERHDRTAQGRHADEPQPAGDDPQLLRGHRPGAGAGQHPPRRAAVARLRALRTAARGPQGRSASCGDDVAAHRPALAGRCRSSPRPRWSSGWPATRPSPPPTCRR